MLVGLSGCVGTLESKAQEFCGQENVSVVYTCGDYIRVVSSLVGTGSTYYKLDAIGALEEVASCPVVAPTSMSEECKALFESECGEKQIC